jgi:hypothetical protein
MAALLLMDAGSLVIVPREGPSQRAARLMIPERDWARLKAE